MRDGLATAAVVLSLATISGASAQTKADQQAVHDLPQAFAAAFNKHDGHQLAQIMAGDVDFVTVGGPYDTSNQNRGASGHPP